MSKRSSSALVLGAVGASAWVIHRVGRRSGVSNEEAVRSLPGDHIVADPLWGSTRATTVDAPPSFVWPWIVQMGSPAFRAGWYTPHWLDELIWGERLRSADQIVPGLQDLKVGDRVPDSVDWSVYYIVEELEAERHLVLRSRSHVFPPSHGIRLLVGLRAHPPWHRPYAAVHPRPSQLQTALAAPDRRDRPRRRR